MDCPTNVPLLRKLGIKPGQRVLFVDAPAGFVKDLGALPIGVTIEAEVAPSLDWIAVFVESQEALRQRFALLAESLAPAGSLWVAWPKKSSGVVTDLTENVVQAIGLEGGLVDNKVCAINATWSALRFVYRVADRPARSRGARR
jgi:hypothetical protein